MGTNRRECSTWPSPRFSRSEGMIRTPPQLRCSSRSKPYLPARGFQGTPNTLAKARIVCGSAAGIGTGFSFARQACATVIRENERHSEQKFMRDSKRYSDGARRIVNGRRDRERLRSGNAIRDRLSLSYGSASSLFSIAAALERITPFIVIGFLLGLRID